MQLLKRATNDRDNWLPGQSPKVLFVTLRQPISPQLVFFFIKVAVVIVSLHRNKTLIKTFFCSYFMCKNVCLHVCLCPTYSQRSKVFDPLGLDLQRVGSGNQTGVLWKQPVLLTAELPR